MERELLLLGLLRSNAMYGYQLNEIIDTHLGLSVRLTKPTAYRLLDEMESKGWVTSEEEREGNRPTRFMYRITPDGEAAFQRLLRECLSDYKPPVSGSDIGFAFVDLLPRREARAMLAKRRATLEDLLLKLGTSKYHRDGRRGDHGEAHHGGFALVIDHQRRLLETERQWLDAMMTRMEKRT